MHHPHSPRQKKPSLHRVRSPNIPEKKTHSQKPSLHRIQNPSPNANFSEKKVSFSSDRDAVSSSTPASSDGGHIAGKVASWLSYGIFTAFFVSLDRCSCVKLDTIDFYEPVPQQQPLLFRSRSRASRHRRFREGQGRDQEEEEEVEAERPSVWKAIGFLAHLLGFSPLLLFVCVLSFFWSRYSRHGRFQEIQRRHHAKEEQEGEGEAEEEIVLIGLPLFSFFICPFSFCFFFFFVISVFYRCLFRSRSFTVADAMEANEGRIRSRSSLWLESIAQILLLLSHPDYFRMSIILPSDPDLPGNLFWL